MYVSPVGLALQDLSFKVKIEDIARQRTKTDASPPFLFVFFFLVLPFFLLHPNPAPSSLEPMLPSINEQLLSELSKLSETVSLHFFFSISSTFDASLVLPLADPSLFPPHPCSPQPPGSSRETSIARLVTPSSPITPSSPFLSFCFLKLTHLPRCFAQTHLAINSAPP